MRPISHERIQTLRSLMEIKASYPVLNQTKCLVNILKYQLMRQLAS